MKLHKFLAALAGVVVAVAGASAQAPKPAAAAPATAQAPAAKPQYRRARFSSNSPIIGFLVYQRQT